jgi:chromosomal replication initiation ATPase DnaA
MSDRQRLEERNLPLEPTAAKMALKNRIAEIKEAMQAATASLDELRAVKRRLVLKLADTLGDDEVHTDRARIKRLVTAATEISWSRIVGRQKSQDVVNARWLIMHMLYQRGYSLVSILSRKALI